MDNRPGYRSFLLRVWRRDESQEWLASLEDTRTGERQGFASIAEAWSFLDAELGQGKARAAREPSGRETARDSYD